MIDPTAATLIVIGFIIIFGVGIPVLNVKAKKFVSYRWCVIVVMLALLIGAVVYGIFEDIDSEWDQVITSVGGSLEVPANRVTLAEYFITATTEGWRSATVRGGSAYVLLYLPAGRYRPLCQIDLTTASTHLNSYPVLLMRIS